LKYVSIDIETTGLNPEEDQILEFGAVIEDTRMSHVPVDELPKFRRMIRHYRISGSPKALAMNARILEAISDEEGDNKDVWPLSTLSSAFHSFLASNYVGTIIKNRVQFTAAGKNFVGFDRLFLDRVPEWKKLVQPNRRVLDPAILYFNPLKDDVLPSLSECLARAGFEPTVKHNAVDDAKDVVRVLRHAFANQLIRGVE